MAYQPKTGLPCYCKRGIERDNCANCEGTGQVIDFAAIRARNSPKPTTGHTPTPWHVGDTDEDGIKIEKDENVDGPWLIARAEPLCNSHLMADGIETAANAAFIVRACNSYAALTSVLDRIVQDIDSGWATEADERFPWLADARDALRLAEGKEAATQV